METNTNNSLIAVAFGKEVVDTIDSFLHKGSRKRFKTIQDAATDMKSVWEKLEFPCEEPVCLDWKLTGIGILNKIIDGNLSGYDAEEHLHGVNGMFNQTFRDAVNVS